MAQEEKSVRRSNISHKVLILVVKYIPLVITLCYILNIILFKFEIDAPVLSNIAGVSLLTWIFLYLSNIVFKFCYDKCNKGDITENDR